MPEQVYMNRMQREVCSIDAHTSVVVAGRGTGKGMLHAFINLRNFQQMPRSTTAFVCPNSVRAKTNTLPSMFQHWESWGFRRGVHWDIGRRPPASLGWPSPLITPEHWENIISFYNGAIGQIISQDRVGTSNSKSFDFVDIDEAKFIDFERLKDETLPANRGQQKEFGDLHFHHGLLITSDMPVTKAGSWFTRYEGQSNKDVIATIEELSSAMAAGLIPDNHRGEAARLLNNLRRDATLYRRYSSLTNIEVLGEAWIHQMKRDLPPLVFRTSILCLPIGVAKDGFYSALSSRHFYSATEFHALDALGYDFNGLREAAATCEFDADVDGKAPLCIAFDYNAKINWLVVGQPNEDTRRLNVVKSFFVKYDRRLPELVDDFAKYYEKHPYKEVVFYFDSTALGSNYAVNNQDFKWVICHQLHLHGWRVRPVYIGAPMNHLEKMLLINRGLAGQARLCPYFNEPNNQALIMALQTAGVRNGKKDKSGEKLAETTDDPLEYRTDGTDAFDTLYIGCERFPQGRVLLATTGSH